MRQPRPTHEPDGTPRNRSSACGAWQEMDGTHAHTYCAGTVTLPPPDDVCTCPCHTGEPVD